jgi:hypothetical protein
MVDRKSRAGSENGEDSVSEASSQVWIFFSERRDITAIASCWMYKPIPKGKELLQLIFENLLERVESLDF